MHQSHGIASTRSTVTWTLNGRGINAPTVRHNPQEAGTEAADRYEIDINSESSDSTEYEDEDSMSLSESDQSLNGRISDSEMEESSPESDNETDIESINEGCRLNKKSSKKSFKIASLNIKGGGNVSTNKWNEINQIIRDESISILAIQEAHLTPSHHQNIGKLFDKQIHIINSPHPRKPSNKAGVTFILNKKHTKWKETTFKEIIKGRALNIQVPWSGDQMLNILNVYAPNKPTYNANFWKRLKIIYTRDKLTKPDIILGDFNMVEDSLDRIPSHSDLTKTTEALQNIKSYFKIIDGWRNTFPDKIEYTFSQQGKHIHSRIDRIYIKTEHVKLYTNWNSEISAIPTDHKIISTKIICPKEPQVGKGRWFIPCFIIENKEFLNDISQEGNLALEKIKNGDSPQTIYNNLKKYIIKTARKYAGKYGNLIGKQIQDLQESLTKIQNQTNTEENIRAQDITALEKE